ncbi:hypothetical protein MHYP_G00019980 [Metynnis hypsauchen]
MVPLCGGFSGFPANCEFSCGEGIAGCWHQRRRKRGRRAGVLMRLKRLLGDLTIPAGVCISAEAEGLERHHISPRSWDDHSGTPVVLLAVQINPSHPPSLCLENK